MATNRQLQRFQPDGLRRVMITGLMMIMAALALLSSMLPSTSSASSAQAGTPTPSKATTTPGGPELVEREASFTVGDIGQFAQPPSLALQRAMAPWSSWMRDLRALGRRRAG